MGGDGAARPGISQLGVSPNLRARSLSNGGMFASGMQPNSDCADGRRLRTIAKTSSMARSHRASSYPVSDGEYSSQIPAPASKLQLPKRRGMILNSSSSSGSSSSPSTSSESREELEEWTQSSGSRSGDGHARWCWAERWEGEGGAAGTDRDRLLSSGAALITRLCALLFKWKAGVMGVERSSPPEERGE